MSADIELELWRQQWHEEDSIPADLRRTVERQSRRMKIGLAGDTVVTVVMGGGTTTWALLSRDSGIALVALATWLFLAIAWACALTVNWGLWRPVTVDAASFVDLSIGRCRAALKAVWLAGILFVAEIAFGLSWAYLHSAIQTGIRKWLLFGSLRVDIVWACTAAFFGGLVWYRSRKRRELIRLLNLRDEIVLNVDKDTQQEPNVPPEWMFGIRRLKRLRPKKRIT